ncbi:NADH:flavin oxidoreductase [Phototrophicus methaneseepsis]|uniref:NADH:flavin oxidoreductase n=1 Tax=Phototrophicus methaneseepsis TaxID=2710758 RepID=A0A7S8EBV1_9CHLR|nr:NADH:flavin oxidoreductase [Phototrophicus methaneseepsis]QPC84112.1 NADH:flavin oxidoreductase [Phototrophicus methaneseepsis]
MNYKRVAQLRTLEQFLEYCQSIGAEMPVDETIATGPDAPLAQHVTYGNKTLSNRFAVLPMEGWDGTPDGHPSDLTRRRWERFGLSGADLIWGGEAVAVRHDGRANARQLIIKPETVGEIAAMRQLLLDTHAAHHGSSENVLIGLQLTHSGRFCRPNTHALEPRIAYRHPLLDKKFNITDEKLVFSDDEIDELIADFGKAAKLAQQAGFDFVDLKHCHGYLGHEFLSAIDREGKYGGSFENRTRFLRHLVETVRREAPGLDIGVRLSAIDFVPFKPDADNTGEPDYIPREGYKYAFGGDGTGLGIDFTEPKRFLDLLAELNIRLTCITVGSPYYNPHIQRPAIFPPSDGYFPPEDPLVGVARQIAVTAELKRHRPDLLIVGSGYSYLQDWLPNVAQAVVRQNMVDFVGLGRMILTYPEIAADTLAGKPLQRKRICRTFSDCTTAPRNGMVSGCYPLDPFYKEKPEYDALMEAKKSLKVTS